MHFNGSNLRLHVIHYNNNIIFSFSLCSWQAWGGTENMAEPRRESTSSLQRKKPPWLRLDIPTAQMSLDEPPTFVQVFCLAESPSCFLSPLSFLSSLVFTLFLCILSCVACEETGVPAQYQHASGDLSPPVPTPRPL